MQMQTWLNQLESFQDYEIFQSSVKLLIDVLIRHGG